MLRRILAVWVIMQSMAFSPNGRADVPSFASFDRRARAGEPLSVVFFGGSLTWGANSSDPQRTSYRALMGQYLQKKYPKSSFTLHDAAIGGTGSNLGMFRLERDVLARQPDLVFLDFTVNDDIDVVDPGSLASYETLLREMIGKEIPVVQVLFACRSHFVPGSRFPDGPPLREMHLKLAASYHTAVGDLYSYMRAVLARGEIKPEDIWPFDATHPDDVGYRVFFEAVRDGLEQAIADGRTCSLPAKPIAGGIYQARNRICLVDRPIPQGWKREKTFRTSLWFDGLSSRWMGDVLVCYVKDKAAVQPIRMDFDGTYAGVFGEADENGLSFQVKIDGQLVMYRADTKTPATVIWPFRFFLPGRLFVWRPLTDHLQLAPGRHTLEIEPIFPEGITQGQLRIESVCVAGP